MNTDRARRACTDVLAVEQIAPGMARVVTFSDAYVVDARGEGCTCPDKQYNLEPGEKCKHHVAAVLATSDLPAPFDVVDNLDERPEPTGTPTAPRVLADGGTDAEWTVVDHDNDGNRRTAESRSEAEEKAATAREFGSENVEIIPPGQNEVNEGSSDVRSEIEPTPDGGNAEVVDVDPEIVRHGDDADQEPTTAERAAELPERSVADDPLNWIPGDFVDEIDGTQAINRKGYEVLSHFYEIDVAADLEVPPEETGFEYCRVKATATTPDGRVCEAYGSAHVDRDDDKTLLLEMADTRARKRALSIATGVGAVAVAELKSEVE